VPLEQAHDGLGIISQGSTIELLPDNLKRRSRYCVPIQAGYRPDDGKIRGGIM
jgi:hypothetical protein